MIGRDEFPFGISYFRLVSGSVFLYDWDGLDHHASATATDAKTSNSTATKTRGPVAVSTWELWESYGGITSEF